MADQTNAHSDTDNQEQFLISAPDTINNVYHLLNVDIRDAAMQLDLDHDEILLEVWRKILVDLFDGGAKSHLVHDEVRRCFAYWKRGIA